MLEIKDVGLVLIYICYQECKEEWILVIACSCRHYARVGVLFQGFKLPFIPSIVSH